MADTLTPETPLHLFEVSMAAFEDMKGCSVYVLAPSIGEAVEAAPDEHPYRLHAPIVVKHLPTITAGGDNGDA